MSEATRFVVVGIGADGWDGLSVVAQRELSGALLIYGSARQLGLLPESIGGERIAWRSPMSAHLRELIDGRESSFPPVVHVLASGDPMFHGIGSTLVTAAGAARVRVVPAPSSVSLAAARLGWDLSSTEIVSLVTHDADIAARSLTDGARVLVLSRDATSPAAIAALAARLGFGASAMTVLGDLGSPHESITRGTPASWPDRPAPALSIIALDCRGPAVSRGTGLPDDEFAHDGQLTKSPIRALTLSALRPADGQTLWDVGAGSGSIGIEWLRLVRRGHVVAFEADPVRAERIAANARRHGVPGSLTVAGRVPEAFAQAAAPDTIFAGGGLSAQVLADCWDALPPGGLLVANAVTIETEELLVAAYRRHGGSLSRFHVEHAAPLGSMTAWRPSLPIVQWVAVREER